VGIGFAIPTSMVKQITTALIETGSFERAYLGVIISDVTEELREFYERREGAIIMSVQEGSAAEKAGLKRGDLIVSVDGKIVKDSGSLKNAVGSLTAGSRVEVAYIRDGKKKSVTVQLQKGGGGRDLADGYAYEGLILAEPDEEAKRRYRIPDTIRGVLVTDVKEASPGKKAGFAEGDVIIQIENKEIRSMEDFKNAVGKNGKKRYFIHRRGAIFVLVL
jgi:serine protease Do